jgi:hypothetical protein
MEVDVFGQRVTGIIVHNPELEDGQMQGIRINIDKTKIKVIRTSGKIDETR